VRPARTSRVHFEEDTHRTSEGSGVVGSDVEINMNSQGEEDEEEVDSRDINQGVEHEVVGSDEEIDMNSQGEEDEEEVDSRDINQGVEQRVTFSPNFNRFF
jgi:hypothetical protein